MLSVMTDVEYENLAEKFAIYFADFLKREFYDLWTSENWRISPFKRYTLIYVYRSKIVIAHGHNQYSARKGGEIEFTISSPFSKTDVRCYFNYHEGDLFEKLEGLISDHIRSYV